MEQTGRERLEAYRSTGDDIVDLWSLGASYLNVGGNRYSDPAELLAGIIKFFQMCEESSEIEVKVFAFQGETFEHDVRHPVLPTWRGIALHLGVMHGTLMNWRKTATEEIQAVLDFAESYMYQLKYQKAAVRIVDVQMVIRDLGLKETVEQINSGTIKQITKEMSLEEASHLYQETLGGSNG
jgi:hypothetical protein